MGDLTAVTGPRTDVTQATNYVWDADRELTMAILADPDGAGPLPRPATQMNYDTGGRLQNMQKGTTTQPNGSDFAAQEETTYVYDGADRLVRTFVLNGPGGSAVSVGQTSYYANGLVQCTAARMNPSVYGSLPASACTPSTQSAVYGPDLINQAVYAARDLTSVQSGVGTALAQTTATLTYTADDKVASYKDARGNTVAFAYDGFDRRRPSAIPTAPPSRRSTTRTATRPSGPTGAAIR